MIDAAYVAHQIDGRIRLRVPGKRGDSSYFETVRQKLSAHPAVEQVKVRPETASVLLRHTGNIAPITSAAAEDGLFRIVDQAPRPATRSVPLATSGLRPRSAMDAVAAGLSGLAVVQVARGQAFGSAVENFWHAFSARQLLQRPGLAGLFAAVGVYQVFSGRLLGSATSLLFYSMVARRLASSEREKTIPLRVASAGNPDAFQRPPTSRAGAASPGKS